MRSVFNSAILFSFILTILLASPILAASNTDGVKKAATTADVVPADKKKDATKEKCKDKKDDAKKVAAKKNATKDTVGDFCRYWMQCLRTVKTMFLLILLKPLILY